MFRITGDPWVDVGVPVSLLAALACGVVFNSQPARLACLVFGIVFFLTYVSIPLVDSYCIGHPFKGYLCSSGETWVATALSVFHQVSVIAYLLSIVPIFVFSIGYEVWSGRR